MNYNKILIGGRLTRDPAMKFLPSQVAICEFGLACNRKFKTANGEDREDVLFVDAAAFGKTAEVINQHFQKGKPIFIEGRLKYDSWDDKNGGGKRSKLSIVVDRFEFVGGPRDDAGDDGDQTPRNPVSGRPVRQNASNPISEEQQMDPSEIPF